VACFCLLGVREIVTCSLRLLSLCIFTARLFAFAAELFNFEFHSDSRLPLQVDLAIILSDLVQDLEPFLLSFFDLSPHLRHVELPLLETCFHLIELSFRLVHRRLIPFDLLLNHLALRFLQVYLVLLLV